MVQLAIICKQEAVEIIVRSACKFLEEVDPWKMDYYRYLGYRGEDPKMMHPSSGDKLILFKLAREMVKTIPRNYRNAGNCRVYGEYLVVDEFCWLYNASNNPYHD